MKASAIDSPTGGRVDLAAYFLRRGFDLLQPGDSVTFVTTNMIGKGDTRDAALVPITGSWGGEIANAVRSEPWVGEATVSVALVHLHKGDWNETRTLDGQAVEYIGPDLGSSESAEPVELAENKDIVSVGTNVLGEGFWINSDERQRLLADDPRNAEIIRPFIGGPRAMQAPDPSVFDRWVIDFGKPGSRIRRAVPRAHAHRQRTS